MKIGLFISDIFSRIGGTEAYCSQIIYALQKIYNFPEITVVTETYRNIKIDNPNIVTRLNSCYSLDIKESNINTEFVFADKSNFIKRYLFEHKIRQASKKFDLFINVTMNPFTFAAKRNVIIIHFPQYHKTKSLFVKKYPFMYIPAMIKDFRYSHNYDLYIANSQYTKQWLEKLWHIKNEKTAIVNPAVSPMQHSDNDKSDFIFVCSRIEESKKIEILIESFLSSEQLRESMKLIIAGTIIIEEAGTYLKQLKALIGNNTDSVVLHENATRNDIENYFKKAKIFWHAKGYGINEETNPSELEHFGITTVEAMSAGCVPVVINKGGQKEIVDNGINGFRWDTPTELIEKTVHLVQYDDERKKMSERAIEKAKQYSLENFTKNFGEALKNE